MTPFPQSAPRRPAEKAGSADNFTDLSDEQCDAILHAGMAALHHFALIMVRKDSSTSDPIVEVTP